MRPTHRHLLIAIAIHIVIASTAFTQTGTEQAGHSATVAGVTVRWLREEALLSVHLSARTTGWIAIGFDPTRQMAGANIIIGYVADGELEIADDYGTGPYRHGRDIENGGTDDIVNAAGLEENGTTSIRFSIPVDSGDPLDNVLVPGESYSVIVAHGQNGADDFSSYHANRGRFRMTIP